MSTRRYEADASRDEAFDEFVPAEVNDTDAPVDAADADRWKRWRKTTTSTMTSRSRRIVVDPPAWR